MVLLEVRDMVKHFGSVRAVNGVSFTVEQGACFGLLGPNGAGKTTTIEVMEGIKTPSSGQVLYKGHPLGKDFRLEAGIMFQSTALQEYITVRETLNLFKQFYSRTTPLEELVESCSLGSFLDRDTHRLSGGQRQRVLLAIALINDPELAFLDEPTTGLDPQARRNFWDLVHSIKAKGKTVILTTHYMDEAYELCDEIVIMDRGRIIAQGSPQALLREHFSDVVLEIPRKDFPAALGPLPEAAREDGNLVEIPSRDVNETIKQLLAMGVSLTHLQIRARTLDDLFLQLTGKELRA